MKYVVIDDEKPARENLKTTLREYFPDLIPVGEADSSKTGVELLNRVSTDLVFLDIDLFDGTGFGMLEKLEKIDFQLIFVTAYNDYAIRAFRVNALYYILKPIVLGELLKAVNRARENQRISQNGRYREMLNNISESPVSQKLAIRESTGIRYLHIADIIRCKSDNSYTEFYLKNGQKFTSSRSLKDYSEILSEFGFFRIHQSHLVRLSSISRIVREGGTFVELDSGDTLPLSRRKKDDLIRKMAAEEI